MKLTDREPPEQRAVRIERRHLRRHPLHNATAPQIDQWIDRNVNSLADAREALKVIAKIAILKP